MRYDSTYISVHFDVKYMYILLTGCVGAIDLVVGVVFSEMGVASFRVT